MMLQIPDILPNRSNRIKFNTERFTLKQSINPTTQISNNDFLILHSQISEISNNIQNNEDSIINHIDILSRLLENYNDNIFDDFIRFKIIPLIIFHMPKEENAYSFFIQFFLNFLKKIEKSNNFDLINIIVTPDIIEFLCEFLRESTKSQSTSFFLQKKTIKVLLITLNHHESFYSFYTDPKYKLLTSLIFIYRTYLRYINGEFEQFHSKPFFNINELNKSYQDLFKSSIYVIDCFSLFFNIIKDDDIRNNLNSIKVVTNLLIDTAFSHCIQVNNEAMASILECSERFPKIFYQCVHQSRKEHDFISLINPTELYDESTHLLSLDIIAFITWQIPNGEIDEFIYKTPIMNYLLELLDRNFDKFILATSYIIINFILKSNNALKSILNDESKIIQSILQHFSHDLRRKEKLAILYLYSACIVSLDDEGSENFLPYFIEIGCSNSLFSELVESIVSTISNEMIIFIMQSIVRLLDYTFNSRTNDYSCMMDIIIQLISPDQVHEISDISKDHNTWALKLVEMIENYQENKVTTE